MPKLLTPKALTALVPNTTENYWAKLRLRNDGPEFLKISKKIYYEESRVLTWLESKRRTSTSDPGPAPDDGDLTRLAAMRRTA